MNCSLRSIALGTLLAFAPVAFVSAANVSILSVIADEAVAEGAVKSVDAKAGSFVLTVGTGKDAKDITVKTDKSTKYTRAGKDAKMEEVVKAGSRVKVTHKDALASKIEAVEEKAPAKPTTPPEKK